MDTWDLDEGVVEFPSGRRIRGRSWNQPISKYADVSAILTTASPETFAARHAVGIGREVVYISWPDNRLPRRPQQAIEQLSQLLERAHSQRVEITCGGGVGRTGTALAMLAIIDGMDAADAIAFVQRNYNPESVSSHAQRGFLMDMEPPRK
ncbi:MAG: protein-tyrosine phosphatase family protein [Actinomycetaceae bacterium]|nr:protein-tyrosine phosphatase family protein [Actinomycetaceae bacterium]MDY5854212.1 protein-tyrosine phosphatase family protein [Arcanobacterium sp.]